MSFIFLIGIAQALFFVVLLLSKKGKSLSDKVLIVWLLFIATHLFFAYGDAAQWALQYPHWQGLGFPLPVAEGPFFFLYVLTLTRNPSRIKPYDYLHFLPFFLVYVISWDFYSMSGAEKTHFIQEVLWADPPLATMISQVLVYVTGPAYALYVLWQLRAHRKKIRRFFSYSDDVDLNWIRNLAIGMLLIWVVVWLVFLLVDGEKGKTSHPGEALIFVAVTLFVFSIGYFGLKQGRVFTFEAVTADSNEAAEALAGEKYQKSGLKSQNQKALLEKLLDFMEEEKPYLNPQLTLRELAEKSAFSPHHLSQLINEGRGQNFFDFVNQYRVSAFQAAIAEPQNQHLTLLAVALDCGFNSKSSFNRTFKQMTGQTPSQYAQIALPKH